MASGTPLIASKLEGIPEEYVDYFIELKDATIDDIRITLERALALPATELDTIGSRAQDFVRDKKNNLIQSKKILDLLYAIKN